MKSIEEIDVFEKTIGQLSEMINDFSQLSKKKPDGSVNIFKIGLVNSILKTLNSIIDEPERPFKSFTQFPEENLPSYSDILVVLNQYHECARNFAKKNVTDYCYPNKWLIEGKPSKREVVISHLFGG